MSSTELVLYGILLNVFAGFVLLGQRSLIVNADWAYWGMVLGLVLGTLGLGQALLATRRSESA